MSNRSSGTKLKNKKSAIFVIAAIAVLFAVIITVTAVKSNSNTIYSGVKAGGVTLSGMTLDEAAAAIKESTDKTADTEISVSAGNDKFSATYKEFGAEYNCYETAKNAYKYGHEGFFNSLIPAMKSVFGGKTDIELVVDISNRKFQKIMSENTDFDSSVEATYEIVKDGVKVKNGNPAYTINPKTAKEALINTMKKMEFSDLSFKKENIEPIPLDVEAFIEEYSGEAKNAEYVRLDDGEISVTSGNDSVKLDKGVAEKLVKMHSEPDEEFLIPAEVTAAERTSSELRDALFRDTLSSYSSSYKTSDSNRSENVRLAASSINGKVLMPGESFSYNDTLGKRTPEAGYKLAGAYSNGESVQEYGGGICQISSTLYCAVMQANLKIESRTCHMFKVGYVPVGCDATVDYGTVDFVFSNNTDYPIKISANTTSSKQANISIIGTKTQDFSVKIVAENVTSIPFTTKTEEVDWLEPGAQKYKQRGSDGAKCTTYRVVSVDGQEVSRTKESSSYYMPHNAVLYVGKAAPAEPVAPEAPASPETTTEQQIPLIVQ